MFGPNAMPQGAFLNAFVSVVRVCVCSMRSVRKLSLAMPSCGFVFFILACTLLRRHAPPTNQQVSVLKSVSPVLWARVLPLLRPCRFEADDVICEQVMSRDQHAWGVVVHTTNGPLTRDCLLLFFEETSPPRCRDPMFTVAPHPSPLV